MSDFDTFLDGLAFPECPRWHDGALWFTDIAAGEVVRVDPESRERTVELRNPDHPAGIGFLPDGRLLVAAGSSRTVLRRETDGRVVQHADLAGLATWQLNDMHVDPRGRAYVGNYGDDSAPPAPPRPAALCLVDTDGSPRAVAEEMMFANGMGLTPDGRTLYVAETRATPSRVTAFDVAEDGSLSNRRELAEFDQTVFPDGIAVAPDASVWVASPFSEEVLHVSADGAVLERLQVPSPYAVALGGADGDELFVCSSPTWQFDEALRLREGRILRARVR